MAATKIKFSPSVNIVRDSEYEFNYIATPNASNTFSSLLNDINAGTKAHLLVGAYGTGKSSFLLAFKQTLEKSYVHFKGFAKTLNTIPDYEFISIVGEYASLEQVIAKRYKLGKTFKSTDVIAAIDAECKALRKKKKGIALLVDEFGKFLEYAAKHNTESELYFIQLLTEWINDVKNDCLFIATLHQGFGSYSLGLDNTQRKEWDKVKGRLKEIPFNEPVEQLLFLAAERIDQKFKNKTVDKNFDKLFNVIKEAKAFPLRDYFDKDTAKKLYPFDILAAGLLTLSLQRYGQNERSLFSFIESNEHLGLDALSKNGASYYTIPNVYDYLLYSYYGLLSTKLLNPNYQQWSNIRNTLEKIDGLFKSEQEQLDAEAIIKTIGLLNIFATGSAKLEPQFYIDYSKLALGIKKPEEILRQLTSKLILRYVKHSFRYTFVDSTDLDIDLAINDAGKLVEKVTNVVHYLNQYFEFPFIAAKATYYEYGTPRFFQFKLTEEPINNLIPEGEVDGFINLVFSEDKNVLNQIRQVSATCGEAIVYGFYKKTGEIKNLIHEIQKIDKVKEDNKDDRIAVRELEAAKQHYIALLNHFVIDSLYNQAGNVLWYANGTQLHINSRHAFNQELSILSNRVYSQTPVYKNEMVNKTKVSGQMSLARKKLLERLMYDLDKPNLGFKETEFPPEKSIYLTLLRETGIHSIDNGVGMLNKPSSASFDVLWNKSLQFLQSTQTNPRSIAEFINILLNKPFKLKQGFIDFWIPVFLLTKKDEFALYENDGFVPDINEDILDLMNKKPGMFSIKAFDVAGIRLELFNRYRVYLNQSEQQHPSSKTFIQTIKPFLSFYRDLSEYAKKTNRLDKKTIALRKAIATAKDPEKTFFEDFPAALGFSMQDLSSKPKTAELFIKQLQEAIRELRTCYDSLIDRFEDYFKQEVLGTKTNFPEYRDAIGKRYKRLKTHLLMPHQKAFFTRLQSELDDKKAWLASVAQSCIGKPLTSITDEEELVLFDRIRDYVYELDNLSEISKEHTDGETEEVLKLEITSFVQGLNKNLLRIPKEKTQELDAQIKKINTNLGKDKKLNIAALTKLLQQLLTNE